MVEPFYYSKVKLDRAHQHRGDADWIADRRARADSVFVPIWRNRNLIFENDSPGAVLLDAEELLGLDAENGLCMFLGLEGERAIFAVELAGERDMEAPGGGLPEGSAFGDLRQISPLLEHGEASLLAYGRALTYWHSKHRFCGACGAETVPRRGGHERKCTNEDCGRVHFPRMDPAVIMLVTRDDGNTRKCLLARGRRFQGIRYSTVAGFVEHGETLEGAVAREVMEETGIQVTDVTYQASQPWPFPASLMLGFRARATSTEITIDEHEIVDARWFSDEDVWAMTRDEKMTLPNQQSISRWLIQNWLEEKAG